MAESSNHEKLLIFLILQVYHGKAVVNGTHQKKKMVIVKTLKRKGPAYYE